MSKSKSYRKLIGIDKLREQTRFILRNKYFNYFIDSWDWEGIDKIQSDYIMRRFWENGTVACFPIKHTDELGFTTYATQKFNMYDWPEIVQLINKWNVPFMPLTPQVVGKDVVLGWCMTNHKPVSLFVDHYINKLVEVEMVLNTNLITHKMPLLIGINPTDKTRAEDTVTRILNDEPVIFTDLEDLQMVKALVNGSEYLLDKLYMYKTSIENELLTFMGIDNATHVQTGYNQLVDEVNANNAVINLSQKGIKANLESFCQQIGEVLNVYINVKPVLDMSVSVYDQCNQDISSPYNEESQNE